MCLVMPRLDDDDCSAWLKRCEHSIRKKPMRPEAPAVAHTLWKTDLASSWTQTTKSFVCKSNSQTLSQSVSQSITIKLKLACYQYQNFRHRLCYVLSELQIIHQPSMKFICTVSVSSRLVECLQLCLQRTSKAGVKTATWWAHEGTENVVSWQYHWWALVETGHGCNKLTNKHLQLRLWLYLGIWRSDSDSSGFATARRLKGLCCKGTWHLATRCTHHIILWIANCEPWAMNLSVSIRAPCPNNGDSCPKDLTFNFQPTVGVAAKQFSSSNSSHQSCNNHPPGQCQDTLLREVCSKPWIIPGYIVSATE